jgi:hypothetical protein
MRLKGKEVEKKERIERPASENPHTQKRTGAAAEEKTVETLVDLDLGT